MRKYFYFESSLKVNIFIKLLMSWYLINFGLLYFWMDLFLTKENYLIGNTAVENIFIFDLIGKYSLFHLIPILGGIGLLLAVFIFFNIFPFMLLPLLYFIHMNLESIYFPLTSGADNLFRIMLFFSIFLFPGVKSSNPFNFKLCRSLVILLIQLQLCVAYWTAGLYKVTGPIWANGVSLYYVLNLEEFRSPILANLIQSSDLLITIGTYFPIFFQLSFGFFIWSKNRKIKLVTSTSGLLFHALLGLMLGLYSFIVFTFAYVLFFKEEDVRTFYLGLRSKLGGIFSWASLDRFKKIH